jgi:hypothetical protein
LARGLVVPATVVDQVKPHRGNWTAFCTCALQSLWDPCHKSTNVPIEQHGCACDVGASMAYRSMIIGSTGRADLDDTPLCRRIREVNAT